MDKLYYTFDCWTHSGEPSKIGVVDAEGKPEEYAQDDGHMQYWENWHHKTLQGCVDYFKQQYGSGLPKLILHNQLLLSDTLSASEKQTLAQAFVKATKAETSKKDQAMMLQILQ